jgi:protein phosphatase
MKTAMKTDVGHHRSINEDRVMVKTGAGGLTLAVVADGMGGHQAGDIASQLAVDAIDELLRPVLESGGGNDMEALVREAILSANDKVFQFASTADQYYGMGTTIVVALADRERIVLGHIGDSRAYLWDRGRFVQLTEDHSLVNELLKRGQISAEEADHHPRRNVLTRALGTERVVEAEIAFHRWKEHDMLLLCTDGLSGLVGTDKMAEVLSADRELDWKADELVRLALEAGGDDNITVILLSNEENQAEDRG